jgi:hypothetical protein
MGFPCLRLAIWVESDSFALDKKSLLLAHAILSPKFSQKSIWYSYFLPHITLYACLPRTYKRAFKTQAGKEKPAKGGKSKKKDYF